MAAFTIIIDEMDFAHESLYRPCPVATLQLRVYSVMHIAPRLADKQ